MTNELHHCRKAQCWIPDLLDKGYVALWPLYSGLERRDGFFIWTFYVKWTEDRGTKANNKPICEKHHKQLRRMWSDEALHDRHEQEVTESWLLRINSQMRTRF